MESYEPKVPRLRFPPPKTEDGNSARDDRIILGDTAKLLYVCVEHALLLQVVRHGVLRQKRRLQPDFGPDPFSLGMRCVGRMVTASAAAELRTEVCALNLIELLDLAPSGVADGAGYIDFQFQR